MGDPLELDGGMIGPDQRLPGELESEISPLLEDAEHWLQVYSELLTFKRTLLRTAEEQGLIRSEVERLARRHRFWEDRVQRLQASRG